MFYQAQLFLEAGRRCAQDKALALSPTDIRALDVPMIVCYAFAMEIYLKLLLGRLEKEHDLWVLFRQLDDPSKREIVRAYENLGKPGSYFEERLKEEARAFEEWRYVYENRRPFLVAGLDNIRDMAWALHAAAKTLKPYLHLLP